MPKRTYFLSRFFWKFFEQLHKQGNTFHMELIPSPLSCVCCVCVCVCVLRNVDMRLWKHVYCHVKVKTHYFRGHYTHLDNFFSEMFCVRAKNAFTSSYM